VSPHWYPILALLCLILVANAVPALIALLRGGNARPVDGGLILRDGHRLLGSSKTWRGLVWALVLTPLAAPILGLPWTQGLHVAAAAMAGDLGASFIKRRLGLPSGAGVPGLDQVPESLLPALLAKGPMGLAWLDLVMAVSAFTLLDLILTPLARRLGHRRSV